MNEQFNEDLLFLSPNDLDRSENSIISMARKSIDRTIELVLTNRFPFEQFTFTKNQASGLTNKAGIYLIINRRTTKLYLGGTGDLAQRKGDYQRNFTMLDRRRKVYSSMRPDLDEGSPKDFYFVPIVQFSLNRAKGLIARPQESVKLQVARFLDLRIEQVLLEHYLGSDSNVRALFYNQKTIGVFMKGNTFGGAPQSGTPDKALMFEGYAWESISAAARSLQKDRKSIRNQLKNQRFNEISNDDFLNFNGIQITNANASTFFDDDPKQLQDLKAKLNLR